MKESRNKYNKVIDKYYSELPDKPRERLSDEEIILSDKLDLALDKMDILKTDTSNCDINIFEIINKGEMIKQNKRNSLEFLIFIFLSLLIISSIILTTIYFGQKFYIYYQLLTIVLIPILIIPIAKLSQTGGI